MQQLKFKHTATTKIAGICGILVPIIVFACIGLAVAQTPWFGWTHNALSDLGVKSNTAALFNIGMILGGIFAFIFSIGLTKILSKKIGAYTLAISSLALVGVGLFPETIFTLHYLASAVFFVFLVISLFIIGITIKRDQFEQNMGIIALIFALFAVVSPVFLTFLNGIALSEALVCFPAFVWCMTYGAKMVVSG